MASAPVGPGFPFYIFIIIWVIAVGAAVGLAFIPATMARKKGYSYGAFWAFGFFMLIPAIIVAAVIEDKTQPRPVYFVQSDPNNPNQGYAMQYKQCSYCKSQNPANAVYCNNCGARL